MIASGTNRKSFLASTAGTLALTALVQPSPGATAPMGALPPQDERADVDLQRVSQQLAALHAPPVQTVTPRIARELPSFADALQAVCRRKESRASSRWLT